MNAARRISIRGFFGACLLGLGVFAGNAFGLPKVERHPLACGEVFPCAPEIERRVDFWIQVFRTWGTDQVIFHDSAHPERVYSVKTTESRCSRKRPGRTVAREKRRIKRQLQQVAAKLQAGGKKLNREQRNFLTLFPSRDPAEIRRASKRIRCQQGNRDRFREALRRFGRYRDYVLRTLKDSGLPEDLQYLPFVESAYNPNAYSPAGAAGLWQIMPRTARTLGLQLNATVDERFDPEAATWGAVRYLLNATKKLQDAAVAKTGRPATVTEINPFVITSYNYGITGMRRAINQFGPDYITVLKKYKSPYFRTAVRNFYASFLAARYVAQNAEEYFGDVETDGVMRYSLVSLTRPTSVKRIQRVLGVSADTLKEMNPALTRYVWRGWRLIPEGYALRLPHRKHGWAKQVAKLERLPAEQPQLSGRKYVVRRGDTACGIAEIFNVKCRDLIQVNSLGRRALIRVGQRLDIPGKPRRSVKSAVAKVSTAKALAATAVVDEDVAEKSDVTEAAAAAAVSTKLSVASVNGVKVDNRYASEIETPADAASFGRSSPQSVEEKQTDTAVATADAEGLIEPLIRELDLKVVYRQRNGDGLYGVRVQPEETLGHYADWLGIGYTRKIRKLNRVSSRTRIQVGRWISLPIQSPKMREEFEKKREEYHRTLTDEFRQHYEVVALDLHLVKKGDSLWQIAREYEIPYWVLTRYNPEQRSPNIGDRVIVPLLKAKSPQEEPPITRSG